MAKGETSVKKEKKLKKSFIKEFRAELKKVNWPNPKQLVNNTVAVITIVLILTAIVFVLDAIFDVMNKYGISQLQNYVVEKFKDNETETESNVDNSSTSSESQEDSNENQTTQESEEQNTTEISE